MAKYGYSMYGFGAYYGTDAIFWPSTLPQKLLQDGYSDEEPDLAIITEMDAPTPKIRRRFTTGIRRLAGKMLITITQKTTLKNFYRYCCAYAFSFPDPETGETVSMVFLEKPQYESTPGPDQYVTLKLGKLP